MHVPQGLQVGDQLYIITQVWWCKSRKHTKIKRPQVARHKEISSRSQVWEVRSVGGDPGVEPPSLWAGLGHRAGPPCPPLPLLTQMGLDYPPPSIDLHESAQPGSSPPSIDLNKAAQLGHVVSDQNNLFLEAPCLQSRTECTACIVLSSRGVMQE